MGQIGVGEGLAGIGAGFAGAGGQNVGNITGNDISQYMNPFQQNVTDAMLANMAENNAQQQQQVQGNAAMKGALGGDRVGVAQSELARQQGLANDQTLSGLNAQNYSQALQTAMSQQQNQQTNAARQLQASGQFGNLASLSGNLGSMQANLGLQSQNAALQGAQAQIGVGNVQQQNQQAQLTSAYQQYLQQLAFPYQQAQFQAGIGLPAAGALGGYQTQIGTTNQIMTPPGVSLPQGIIGGGALLGGLLGGAGGFSGFSNPFGGSGQSQPTPADGSGGMNRGGHVYPHFAKGGRSRDDDFDVPHMYRGIEAALDKTLIPAVSPINITETHPNMNGMAPIQGIPQASNQSALGTAGSLAGLASAGKSIGGLFGSGSALSAADAAAATGAVDASLGTIGGIDAGLAAGAGAGATAGAAGVGLSGAELAPLLLLKRGGSVPKYDSGGATGTPMSPLLTGDFTLPQPMSPQGPVTPQGRNPVDTNYVAQLLAMAGGASPFGGSGGGTGEGSGGSPATGGFTGFGGNAAPGGNFLSGAPDVGIPGNPSPSTPGTTFGNPGTPASPAPAAPSPAAPAPGLPDVGMPASVYSGVPGLNVAAPGLPGSLAQEAGLNDIASSVAPNSGPLSDGFNSGSLTGPSNTSIEATTAPTGFFGDISGNTPGSKGDPGKGDMVDAGMMSNAINDPGFGLNGPGNPGGFNSAFSAIGDISGAYNGAGLAAAQAAVNAAAAAHNAPGDKGDAVDAGPMGNMQSSNAALTSNPDQNDPGFDTAGMSVGKGWGADETSNAALEAGLNDAAAMGFANDSGSPAGDMGGVMGGAMAADAAAGLSAAAGLGDSAGEGSDAGGGNSAGSDAAGSGGDAGGSEASGGRIRRHYAEGGDVDRPTEEIGANPYALSRVKGIIPKMQAHQRPDVFMGKLSNTAPLVDVSKFAAGQQQPPAINKAVSIEADAAGGAVHGSNMFQDFDDGGEVYGSDAVMLDDGTALDPYPDRRSLSPNEVVAQNWPRKEELLRGVKSDRLGLSPNEVVAQNWPKAAPPPPTDVSAAKAVPNDDLDRVAYGATQPNSPTQINPYAAAAAARQQPVTDPSRASWGDIMNARSPMYDTAAQERKTPAQMFMSPRGMMEFGARVLAANPSHGWASAVGQGAVGTLGTFDKFSSEDLSAKQKAMHLAADIRKHVQNFDLARERLDQDNWKPSYAVTKDGHPILYNPKEGTALDVVTGKAPAPDEVLQAARGAGGASSVFNAKLAAFRAAGYGEKEALEAASGRRQVSPAEAYRIGLAAAQRMVADSVVKPPEYTKNPQAWLDTKAKEFAHNQLTFNPQAQPAAQQPPAAAAADKPDVVQNKRLFKFNVSTSKYEDSGPAP